MPETRRFDAQDVTWLRKSINRSLRWYYVSRYGAPVLLGIIVGALVLAAIIAPQFQPGTTDIQLPTL